MAKTTNQIISKNNFPLRYKMVLKTIKTFTPILYKKIKLLGLIQTDVRIKGMDANIFPRPSILAIKEAFKDKELIGCEIGVWKGTNAKSILYELNMKKLYLVDSWCYYEGIEQANYGELENIYKQVKEGFDYPNVRILKGMSTEVVNEFDDESLDFVYIDGNHQYDYILADLIAWAPKVKQNGFVAGHDVFNVYDVLKAVKKYCLDHYHKFYIKLPDWYFIKE